MFVALIILIILLVSRYLSYIFNSVILLNSYSAEAPFAFHLKKYFASNKKFGSTDRKTIATLCYHYFRAGHLFADKSLEDKILFSLFLCEHFDNPILKALKPELNGKISDTIENKCQFLQISPVSSFPFLTEISDMINKESFINSFFYQPLLFLRIRPGRDKIVKDKLIGAGISFTENENNCLALKNSIAINDILALNKEAVVQDASSQRVFSYLSNNSAISFLQPVPCWDCCAASGGKSILLYDVLNKNIKLTVSDIRKTVLYNCQKRLKQAGVNIHNSFLADLVSRGGVATKEEFSIIVCDVPCSGRGTWARTPEQLHSFKKNQIDSYADRQKKIVTNVEPHLQNGGLLFYITCSVFAKENEEVVKYISNNTGLKLLDEKYMEGFDRKADTMFVAVFTK